MKIKTNRFLNEALTNKVVEMLKKEVASHASFIEIDLRENAIAIVTVEIDNESYELSYSYNINKVDFLTVHKK